VDATINLKHAIDQLVKEKGIDRQVVLDADVDDVPVFFHAALNSTGNSLNKAKMCL
jgi:hypothetical protein